MTCPHTHTHTHIYIYIYIYIYILKLTDYQTHAYTCVIAISSATGEYNNKNEKLMGFNFDVVYND